MIIKRHIFYALFLIVGCMCTSQLRGQQYISSVKKLTAEDGLNGQIKYKALIDKNGFLWMSSAYGLDRYDGNEVLNIPFPPGLNEQEQIIDFYETQQGKLLVLTAAQFVIEYYSFHWKKFKIFEFAPLSNKLIPWKLIPEIPFNLSDVISSDVGISGLSLMLKDQSVWTYQKSLSKKGRIDDVVGTEHWCVNSKGNLVWGLEDKIIEKDGSGVLNEIGSFPEKIIAVTQDQENNYQIQVTTENEYFRSYVLDENFKTLLTFDQNDFIPLFKTKALDGNYLLQQNGKIELRNKQGETIINYSELLQLNTNPGFKNYQWSYQSPYSNTIVIQSFDTPYIINRVSSPFTNYFSDAKITFSARGIATTPDGKILINSGPTSYFLDASEKLIDTIRSPFSGEYPLLTSRTNIYDQHNNCFWVSHPIGIFEYKLDSKEKTSYPCIPGVDIIKMVTHKSLHSPFILTINGLYEFNKECQCIKKVNIDSKDHPINNIELEELKFVGKQRFIFSPAALFEWDPFQNKVIQTYPYPKNLRNVQILDFYVEDNNNFWLATKGHGIFHWVLSSNELNQYSTANGLSRDVVYAIKRDKKGRFWLPTTYGLNCLDPSTGVVRNYLPEDGLPHYEFNTHSHHQDESGKMYFGGLSGFTVFDPNDIDAVNPMDPKTMITNVSISAIGSNEVTNWDPIADAPIIFNNGTEILEVKFSTVNINNTSPPQFQYRFEETGEPWQNYSGTSLSFTNLQPGNYILNIRGKDSQNSWSKDSTSLKIKVPTPFLQSIWFWLLMTFALLVAGFLYARWRISYLQKSKLALIAEVEKRTLSLQTSKNLIESQAEELKQLDQLKSRFFTNISHELRTPLTLILNPLKSIKQKNYTGPNLKNYVDTAYAGSHQLQQLIERILRLSDLDAKSLEPKKDKIKTTTIVQSMIEPYRSAANALGITFISNAEEIDAQLIEVDSEKLKEIIDSIISNALKYCQEGDTITSKLQFEQGLLTFSCQDTGIGIDHKDQEKIFTNYYQVAQPTIPAQGGLGIGLPMARTFAKIMKGHLVVHCKVKEGATFTLSIPCSDSIGTEEAILLSGENHTALSLLPADQKSPVQQSTILLVEDHHMLRSLMSNMLSPNYTVQQASNGKKALEFLTTQNNKKQKTDLIITDWMMPQMDGPTFLEALKSDKNTRNIPVIMLTARASQIDRLSMLKIGLDDYLIKPFDPEELKIRVLNLLNNQRERKEQLLLNKQTAPNPIFAQEPSVHEKWLKQLEKEVTTQLSDSNFSIVDLAQRMNISERQLNRKIKSLTGLTPGNYIRECRLLRARHLLENKLKYTVSEVCFAVGFSTQEYFSKIFYQRFGKMPSSYL